MNIEVEQVYCLKVFKNILFLSYFFEMASTANLTTINIVPWSLSCLLMAIIFMCVCRFVVEMFQVILIKCSLLGCQEVCFACGVSCPSEILSSSYYFVPVSPHIVKTVGDL